MSKTRLSPLQRAYWMGYRRAKAQMRRELDAMAQRWDDEIAEFTDEMRAAREQTVRHINDEIVGLADEMQSMRNKYRRWQAVERAIATERDPDTLLN
jgi:recombinational DNA repair ATPase RecF